MSYERKIEKVENLVNRSAFNLNALRNMYKDILTMYSEKKEEGKRLTPKDNREITIAGIMIKRINKALFIKAIQ